MTNRGGQLPLTNPGRVQAAAWPSLTISLRTLWETRQFTVSTFNIDHLMTQIFAVDKKTLILMDRKVITQSQLVTLIKSNRIMDTQINIHSIDHMRGGMLSVPLETKQRLKEQMEPLKQRIAEQEAKRANLDRQVLFKSAISAIKNAKANMKQIRDTKKYATDKSTFKTTLTSKLVIANQNMRGAGANDPVPVKFRKILHIMDKFKVDIQVLTEVKSWNQDWTTQLNQKGFQVVTAVLPRSVDNAPRGGVVIISNSNKAMVRVLDKWHNGTLTVHCTTVNHMGGITRTSEFKLSAVYVNPAPTEPEQRVINLTVERASQILEDTQQPYMIVGDFNTNGIRAFTQIAKRKDVTQHVNEPTWSNQDTQTTPDRIYTRGISTENLIISEEGIGDHKLQCITLKGLEFGRQLRERTKTDIEAAWHKPELKHQWIMGAYPMRSTEELTKQFVERKPRTRIMSTGKIDFTKNMNEIRDQLKQKKSESRAFFEEWIQETDYTQDPEEIYSFMATQKHTSGNSIQVITQVQQSDGTLLSLEESQKEIAKWQSQKFNSTKLKNNNDRTEEAVNNITGKRFTQNDQELQELLQRNNNSSDVYIELMKQIQSKNLQTTFISAYRAVKYAISRISKSKGVGTDLFPGKALQQRSIAFQCNCNQCVEKRLPIVDLLQELKEAGVKWIPITNCDKKPELAIDFKLKNVMASRLAIMLVLNITPTYFVNSRLAPLSKNKSTVATSISDIRPIGILPYPFRIAEKALKHLIDTKYPRLFQTGRNQAAFSKDACTSDHTIAIIDHIEQEKKAGGNKERIWISIDISRAYDSVIIQTLNQVIKERAEDWLKAEPIIANIIIEWIMQSNLNMTVTVNQWTFNQLNGLIQGSALAPDLYKIYYNELTNRDETLRRMKMNTDKISEIWQSEKSLPRKTQLIEQLRKEGLLWKFADDMLLTFPHTKEFIAWDCKRIPIWKEMGFELNTRKTKVLKFGNASTLKPILTNNDTCSYDTVNTITYLGSEITTRSIGGDLNRTKVKSKIAKMIWASPFTKPCVQLRIQRIYIESVFRFYYTPMVLSGLIKVNQALLDFSTILRKQHKIHNSVSAASILTLVPQFHWVVYWKEQAQRLWSILPWKGYTKIEEQLSAVKTFNDSQADRITEYTEMLKAPMPFKLFTDEEKTAIIKRNLRPPTFICLGCGNRQEQIFDQSEQLGEHHIYTDASTHQDQGQNVTAAGYYHSNRKVLYTAVVRDYKGQSYVTNNSGEVIAMYLAIQYAQNHLSRQRVIIHTDSKYTIDSVENIERTILSKEHKYVKHAGLLVRIHQALKKANGWITMNKVKAHRIGGIHNQGNSIVDFAVNMRLLGINKRSHVTAHKPENIEEATHQLCETCKCIWARESNQSQQARLNTVISQWERRPNNNQRLESDTQERKFMESEAKDRMNVKRKKLLYYVNRSEDSSRIPVQEDTESISTSQMSKYATPRKYKLFREQWTKDPKDLDRWIISDTKMLSFREKKTVIPSNDIEGILKGTIKHKKAPIIRVYHKTGILQQLRDRNAQGHLEISERVIDWNSIVKASLQFNMISELRKDTNLIRTTSQWYFSELSFQPYRVARKVPTIFKAMAMSRGHDPTQGRQIYICQYCNSSKDITVKASIDHVRTCFQYQYYTNSDLQDPHEMNQQYLNVLIQLQRTSKWLLYNQIQPQSTSLYAHVVIWSKNIVNLYQRLHSEGAIIPIDYAAYTKRQVETESLIMNKVDCYIDETIRTRPVDFIMPVARINQYEQEINMAPVEGTIPYRMRKKLERYIEENKVSQHQPRTVQPNQIDLRPSQQELIVQLETEKDLREYLHNQENLKPVVKKLANELLRTQIKMMIKRGVYFKGTPSTFSTILQGIRKEPVSNTISKILNSKDTDSLIHHLDDKTMHKLLKYTQDKVQEVISTMNETPVIPARPVKAQTRKKKIPSLQMGIEGINPNEPRRPGSKTTTQVNSTLPRREGLKVSHSSKAIAKPKKPQPNIARTKKAKITEKTLHKTLTEIWTKTQKANIKAINPINQKPPVTTQTHQVADFLNQHEDPIESHHQQLQDQGKAMLQKQKATFTNLGTSNGDTLLQQQANFIRLKKEHALEEARILSRPRKSKRKKQRTPGFSPPQRIRKEDESQPTIHQTRSYMSYMTYLDSNLQPITQQQHDINMQEEEKQSMVQDQQSQQYQNYQSNIHIQNLIHTIYPQQHNPPLGNMNPLSSQQPSNVQRSSRDSSGEQQKPSVEHGRPHE